MRKERELAREAKKVRYMKKEKESIKVVCTDIERRITMTNRQLNVI